MTYLMAFGTQIHTHVTMVLGSVSISVLNIGGLREFRTPLIDSSDAPKASGKKAGVSLKSQDIYLSLAIVTKMSFLVLTH